MLRSYDLRPVTLAVQDSSGNPIPYNWDTFTGTFTAAVITGDTVPRAMQVAVI